MSQSQSNHVSHAQAEHDRWRGLCQAGAVAPLIALAFYLIEFSLLIVGEPYPTTIDGWYALVQRSKLLGLWYLNALDILSFALLGIMFLALCVALRRVRPSWMLIALYFALLGVVVFIVPRTLHLSLLPLSDLHAAATTEAQRILYLAAGEALSQVSSATPQTLGFLLMAVAGLIISVVVLQGTVQSRPFGKAVAYVGIVGFVAALANYVTRLFAPDVAAMVMPLNGLLWFAWWIMVSGGLFRLAKVTSHAEIDSTVGCKEVRLMHTEIYYFSGTGNSLYLARSCESVCQAPNSSRSIVTALPSSTPDQLLTFPVWNADFAVPAPAWLAGGMLLRQRKGLGCCSWAACCSSASSSRWSFPPSTTPPRLAGHPSFSSWSGA